MIKADELEVGKRYYDSELDDHFLVISFLPDSPDILVKYDSYGLRETFTYEEMLEYACIALDNLTVSVQRLNDDAVVPEYKTAGAAGFDLHITENVTVPANKVIINFGKGIKVSPDDYSIDVDSLDISLTNDNHAVVGTGLAFEIPVGYELEIRSRSGNVFKDIKVFAYNGTIDADFRGEVRILLTNLGNEDVSFNKGDRVAQGIIKRIEQVSFVEAEELSETSRGTGGFGSTGRN